MDNEIRVCTMLYDFVRVALDKTWSVISIWSRYYRRNSTSGSKHSRLSVLTRGESVRSGLTRSVGSSIDSFGLVFPLLVPWWKIVEFLSRRVGPRYFFRIPYQSWFAYSTDVGKIGHRFEPSKRIGSVFHSTRPDRREINRKVGRRANFWGVERSVRTICPAVLKIDILPARNRTRSIACSESFGHKRAA